MNTETANETFSEFELRINKDIGKKIKYLRRIKDLSQTDLAKHLDITFQQLQKYESGKNKVSIASLIKITEILQININVFFDTGFWDKMQNIGK